MDSWAEVLRSVYAHNANALASLSATYFANPEVSISQWHCGGQGFETPRLHHFIKNDLRKSRHSGESPKEPKRSQKERPACEGGPFAFQATVLLADRFRPALLVPTILPASIPEWAWKILQRILLGGYERERECFSVHQHVEPHLVEGEGPRAPENHARATVGEEDTLHFGGLAVSGLMACRCAFTRRLGVRG